MTTGQVLLHFIRPEAAATDCLSPDERERAARFRFATDRAVWMGCRAGLREILARQLGIAARDVIFKTAEFGKPLLAPPHDALHFNLSHTPELALVAVGIDGPVGVDLEPLDRAGSLLGCEDSFCHPLEISGLPAGKSARATALLRIWTAKEAVLKALGTGLSEPPETIRIVFGPDAGVAVSDRPLAGLDGQRLHVPVHPALAGFAAVVSAPAGVREIAFA